LLLLDTGAGIGAAVLRLVALAHEMIVITTPNLAATLDAYGVIKAAHEARVPAIVRVLVNEADDEAMAGVVFGRIKGCAERFLGTAPRMLGWLPAEPAFEEANRQRRPLVVANPEHPCSQRIREQAERLHESTVELAPHAAHNTVAA
jgi:flagellar biosynthesis protein FlhG